MTLLPTLATLRLLVEWFDNPNLSPPVVVTVDGKCYTASYLLRLIAMKLEAEAKK